MFGTYCRLNIHTSASARELIHAAYGKLSPEGRTNQRRAERHQFLRAMLSHHRNAQALIHQCRL